MLDLYNTVLLNGRLVQRTVYSVLTALPLAKYIVNNVSKCTRKEFFSLVHQVLI